MKNTKLIFFVAVTISLPKFLHCTTTEFIEMVQQIQSGQTNENDVINFRIPEYFDLKGEKLNSLIKLIRERSNMLNANELKRNEIHKRYLWILRIILPTYAMASVIWIILNIMIYKRQKQKLKSGCNKNTINGNRERQRLLERYNQIPTGNLPFINQSATPATELNDENDFKNESLHSTFEINRARIEAILKLNNEPQFMRRI